MKIRFPPLMRRRTALRPTWAGWLAILVAGVGLIRLSAPGMYRFLAVSDPEPGDYLIVEGWLSDRNLTDVQALYREHNYRTIFATGGPLTYGSFLSEYEDMATVTHLRLLKIGLPVDRVVAVTAPGVHKDRTYASALALRHYLDAHEIRGGRFQLLTEGAHARRSRLLFRKALGPDRRVGCLALPPEDYDPRCWWHSSSGVRGVIYEGLAYGYTRLWMWFEADPPAATAIRAPLTPAGP